MTLILSANFRNWASVQVSDRRLSQYHGSRRYDYANKALVVKCADAIIAVAFSGQARVASDPTDDWLARHLWGKKRGEVPDAAVLGAADFPWLRLDEALHRLKAAVQEAARDPRLQLDVSITGQRLVHEGSALGLPFWAMLTADAGRIGMSVSPKFWYTQDGAEGAEGVVSRGSGARLARRFIREMTSDIILESPIDLEQLLVRALREVAARDHSVGANAMVVTLNSHPSIRRDALVKFEPAPDAAPTADFYTPWVLAPGLVAPPTITVANGALLRSPITTYRGQRMWPFEVEVVAPAHESDGKTLLRVVRAPSPPNRLPATNSRATSAEVWNQLPSRYRGIDRAKAPPPSEWLGR